MVNLWTQPWHFYLLINHYIHLSSFKVYLGQSNELPAPLLECLLVVVTLPCVRARISPSPPLYFLSEAQSLHSGHPPSHYSWGRISDTVREDGGGDGSGVAWIDGKHQKLAVAIYSPTTVERYRVSRAEGRQPTPNGRGRNVVLLDTCMPASEN